MSAWVGVVLKFLIQEAVIGNECSPGEVVFENHSAYNGACEPDHGDNTDKGTAANGGQGEQASYRKQQRRLADKLEQFGVKTDGFSNQRFTAQERVVIELVSPGCAHIEEIARDQQDGTSRRPKQEPPLNNPVGSIIHLDEKGATRILPRSRLTRERFTTPCDATLPV
jgi:hypothetical protein